MRASLPLSRSLAAYIYERLAYGIDDITAAVNSIEWLRQKKGPNRVCHSSAEQVQSVFDACRRCRTWDSCPSSTACAPWPYGAFTTRPKMRPRSSLRCGFPKRTTPHWQVTGAGPSAANINSALLQTQLWHQNSEIRDAVRPWVIALDYWRVSAKGGPGTFGQSQYQLGRAALAAPPAVLSKIFLAMLGTALSRAKTDDQLGHRLAVDDMLKYFNKKTMPLVSDPHRFRPQSLTVSTSRWHTAASIP